MISSLTQMHLVRPRVVVRAKKDDFVATRDDIGGRERITSEPENPIKKLIKKFFKIEEIDYEKFRKENKWAIRPGKDKHKE